MGLGFADKKSGRGLPAGLVPFSDTFPEGKLPEVEILVGDSSFGENSAAPLEGDDSDDLYKPKVSTWGVFPRPNNISKAVWLLTFVHQIEILDILTMIMKHGSLLGYFTYLSR